MQAAFITSFISSSGGMALPDASSLETERFSAVIKRDGPKLFSKEGVNLNWRDVVCHTCHGQKLITCLYRMY